MIHAVRVSIVAAVMALSFPVAAWAQEPAAPFTGVVNGDDVYLRAGPSKTYYHVGKVHTGDLVKVKEILYGWYMIQPPEGQFSYISSQYVEMTGDGNIGRVTGDDVRVRAPSPAGPNQSYKIQLKLDRNAKVKVLGQEKGWYRIEPPAGAMLYIYGNLVDRATEQQIAAARRAAQPEQPAPEQQERPAPAPAAPNEPVAPEEAEQPTEPQAQEPADTQPAATQGEPNLSLTEPVTDVDSDAPEPTIPTAEDVAAEANAATAPTAEVADANDAGAMPNVQARLSKLDQRFKAARPLPLDERPIEALLADYRAVEAGYELNDAQAALVEARISVLRAWRELQQARAELARTHTRQTGTAATGADSDRSAATEPAEAAPAGTGDQAQPADQPEAAEAPDTPDYTAVGKLLASTLYTGEHRPLLYRLIDPSTGLTVGYVEPRDDKSLRPLLGQVVGIVGSKRYQPGLKLNIISVERADALQARERPES